MSVCTILACQIAVPLTRENIDRDNHVDRLIGLISKKLSETPADLVVLPELSTIEYSRESFSRLDQLAEDLNGRSVEKMQQLAHEHSCFVVFGMPRVYNDHYRISQLVIDSSGNVHGVYDKLHVCQYGASMEKDYFMKGDSLLLFEVNEVRFSPIICYDIRIPELSRILATDYGVECMIHCGAYFRDESFNSWDAFVTTRAMENQMFYLSLNRAGSDYGDSMFSSPWVDENTPLLRMNEIDEDFAYFTVDNSHIRKIRDNYTFLKDKIDDYSTLEVRS